MAKSDKDAAFQTALSTIRKNYGDDAIIDMGGEITKGFEVDFVSTGSLSLDRVLGGGLPRGRVIEIFGAPSGGKSVLAIYLMAQIQKLGEKAVLVDSEFSFSPAFATKIGLDVDKLMLAQSRCGEEALDVVRVLAESSSVGIIVVDSVASLVPRAELEGEISDQQMALTARMMSKALRILAGSISKSKTIVIFINQVRDKVSTFPSYGPRTISTGGVALKFYSSIRLQVTKGKNITASGEDKAASDSVIGNFITVSAVKNKVAPPFKQCELELLYEKGIDTVGDLLDIAVADEVITKTGNTLSYKETKLGVGREQSKKFLSDEVNKKIYKEIYEKVCQTK
jgi:recombination protein RecA